jgi:hypothetical protein
MIKAEPRKNAVMTESIIRPEQSQRRYGKKAKLALKNIKKVMR